MTTAKQTRHIRSAPTLTLTFVGLIQSGCSWIFVDPAPEGRLPRKADECTRSYVAPTVDLGFAAGSLLTSVLTVMNVASSHGVAVPASVAVLGVTSAMEALVGDASAANGYMWVSDCRTKMKRAGFASDASVDLQDGAQPIADGCRKDSDCKGERICELGLCKNPDTFRHSNER